MVRERPADHLPPHVLAREDFVDACARRDLGEVLRLAKKWGGLGFTASHLARRCELTVSRVQDYINGRVQAQRIELFERVADGLQIPGVMFELGPRPWEKESEQGPVVLNVAHDEPFDPDGDISVLRSDFMKLGIGLAASTLVDPVVGTPSRVSGNRVGASSVQELRSNVARLRRLDDHLGGADTYSLYITAVRNTESFLRQGSFSSETRGELLVLLAEQAQQAGWAAFDAGWQADATRLFVKSFDAAKEADNPALAGNALALRSYQLLSTGTVATDLTERSCVIAGGGVHPAVKSLLYQRAAWTYAVAGQPQRAAQVLGRAEEALVLAWDGGNGGQPEIGWAAWAHNEVELQIMAGRVWTELRRPLRAVPALEAAMAKYDDSHARDKALYLSWLTEAYLDAGEIEHAAAVAGKAFDLSTDVASVRPQQRLEAVTRRLEPHKKMPEVSGLLARRSSDPLKIRR